MIFINYSPIHYNKSPDGLQNCNSHVIKDELENNLYLLQNIYYYSNINRHSLHAQANIKFGIS